MEHLERIQAAFSSIHHVFIHDGLDSKPLLIPFLQEKLPHIEKTSWEQRIDFGGVFINGLSAIADCPLPNPCRVEYYEPKFPLDEAEKVYAQFSDSWVLWEDPWLVACYKPARLPTMPAKEQRHYCLKNYLEKHLSKELHFPSRLDMSTQGIVIASKHPDMHGLLQQVFEKREIQKYYLFFSHAALPSSPLSVSVPIGKTGAHPVLRAPFGKDAKEAQTTFRQITQGKISATADADSTGNFIEAVPHTGRTHQIRVHAASIHCPVAGDKFYNGAFAPQLCLLSYKASFIHPITGEKLCITIPETLCPDWARQALFNVPDLV